MYILAMKKDKNIDSFIEYKLIPSLRAIKSLLFYKEKHVWASWKLFNSFQFVHNRLQCITMSVNDRASVSLKNNPFFERLPRDFHVVFFLNFAELNISSEKKKVSDGWWMIKYIWTTGLNFSVQFYFCLYNFAQWDSYVELILFPNLFYIVSKPVFRVLLFKTNHFKLTLYCDKTIANKLK